MLPTE